MKNTRGGFRIKGKGAAHKQRLFLRSPAQPFRNTTTRAIISCGLQKIALRAPTAPILRLNHRSLGHVLGSSHICLRFAPIELHPMICKSALAIALSLSPCTALCQTEGGTLPAETPLALSIDDHLPMRDGQPVRAHLLYPVYHNDKLLLPKDTVVAGTVVALRSDRPRRIRATMGGDFTPFKIPVVH